MRSLLLTRHHRGPACPLGPYRSWRRLSCVRGLLLPSTPPRRSRSGAQRSQFPPLTLVFVFQTTSVSCFCFTYILNLVAPYWLYTIHTLYTFPGYCYCRCHHLELQGDRHGRGSSVLGLDARLPGWHGCCHWVAGPTPGPDSRPQRLRRP